MITNILLAILICESFCKLAVSAAIYGKIGSTDMDCKNGKEMENEA